MVVTCLNRASRIPNARVFNLMQSIASLNEFTSEVALFYKSPLMGSILQYQL